MKIKSYILVLLFFSLSHAQLKDNLDSNALKSLILPGWGEMNLNESQRSQKFFISEACLWLSFAGSYYGNQWYTDNYMSFGSYHAGIDLNSISSDQLSLLIVHMSQYDNMEDYNETMDRQRSNSSYPDDSNYNWDWDSDDSRNTFNDLRIKSRSLKKINNLTISALVLNRLISFFDVIYLNGRSYKLDSYVIPTPDNGLLLNCNIHF